MRELFIVHTIQAKAMQVVEHYILMPGTYEGLDKFGPDAMVEAHLKRATTKVIPDSEVELCLGNWVLPCQLLALQFQNPVNWSVLYVADGKMTRWDIRI